MITDPWFYAAAIPAILLAGISKSTFGSGAGVFATPLVALAVPIPQAAAILLPILCLMDLAGVWAYRRTFSRENLRLIMAGGLLGVAIGALSFRYLSDAWIRTAVGAITVAFVAHRYLRRENVKPEPASVAKGLFWSTVSGMTSTIAHAGGPALSVYLLPQRMEKATMVGTSVIFFALMNYVKIVPYAWLGLFDARNLSTSAVLAPLAPLGIWVGVLLLRRLPQSLFYTLCYSLLFVVGLKLLVDGLRAL